MPFVIFVAITNPTKLITNPTSATIAGIFLKTFNKSFIHYLLRLINSSKRVSETVIIRLFAWEPILPFLDWNRFLLSLSKNFFRFIANIICPTIPNVKNTQNTTPGITSIASYCSAVLSSGINKKLVDIKAKPAIEVMSHIKSILSSLMLYHLVCAHKHNVFLDDKIRINCL